MENQKYRQRENKGDKKLGTLDEGHHGCSLLFFPFLCSPEVSLKEKKMFVEMTKVHLF